VFIIWQDVEYPFHFVIRGLEVRQFHIHHIEGSDLYFVIINTLLFVRGSVLVRLNQIYPECREGIRQHILILMLV